MKYTPSLILAVVVLIPVHPGTARAQKRVRPVSPEVHADGKVTFRFFAPKAEKVFVGSLELQAVLKNYATSMTKGDDGVWSVTVGPLPPGIYDYTFNCDGVVTTDPSSTNVFGDRTGSRGFVDVPGPKGKPRIDEWRDVPHGAVTIHWYHSKATDTRRRLHVYTPPGYSKETARKYPVLYLLHGSGDHDGYWTDLGRANVTADNLLADGKMVPMLIVMPDGHVGAHRPGPADPETRLAQRRLFEKDLLESVVPLVESTYRVSTDSAHRAIAGLSMGSAQALGVGLAHSDRFAWIGGFSGALRTDDPVTTGLRSNSEKVNQQVKLLWLAIGTEDTGLKNKQALSAALKEIGIKHEYHETAGGHRWSVWRGYLAEFLPRVFR